MRKILLISVLFFLALLLKAQNQVSGYISLKWISGTTYQATIMDYTVGDPKNSGFCGKASSDTIRLWWGDGTSELFPDSISDSLCECKKGTMYVSGPHTFPGYSTYRLWAQVGGNVPNILNMPGSVNDSLFLYNVLILNPFTGYKISTPLITNPPICSNGCLGQCYTFNLGADTVTGEDSLSYSLGNIMAPGYYIPKNVTINPVTGTLSWCNPDSIGLYNFLIRITTYSKIVYKGKPSQLAVDTMDIELQVNIQDSCVLGIDKIINPEAYSIYPNPAGNEVNINAPDEYNKVITIYNVLGQPIISEEEGQKQFIVNTSGLSNGVYFVNIKEVQTGRSYTLKLIKN